MSPELKLAYYRKSDWGKFLQSVADRDTVHDTWEEWNKAYEKAKKNLKKQGAVVHEITIDIDELKRYCNDRGLKNDGRTRSQYVARLPLTRTKT